MNALPGVGDVLDEMIARRNDFRTAQRLLRPHATGPTASSLGYCLQRQLRDLQEPENRRPFDAELLRRFEIGNRLEEMVLSAYRASGMHVEPPEGDAQWRLHDEEWNITARLDFLLVWPPVKGNVKDLSEFYSEDYIEQVLFPIRDSLLAKWKGATKGYHSVELKTASSGSMKYRFREETPMFTHEMQVGTEMAILKRNPNQLPGPVRSWNVTYLGKDYAGCLTIGIHTRSAEEAARRCQALADLIKADTPWTKTPCECSKNGDASFCAYLEDVTLDTTPKLKKDWTITYTCCAGNGKQTRLRRGPQDDRAVEDWAEKMGAA